MPRVTEYRVVLSLDASAIAESLLDYVATMPDNLPLIGM